MKDPFFEKLRAAATDRFQDWINSAETNHIWSGDFPQPLSPGIYKLKITYKKKSGKEATQIRLFEVM
jgi:hypothetical protein